MRIFLNIIKYRLITSLKHPVILVCLLLALFSSVTLGVYSAKNEANFSTYPIAIVDEDGGKYTSILIDRIDKNQQLDVILVNKDTAIKQVSVGKIDGAFILLNGFSNSIENNDYEGIIEFISPTVTTSAYPISEIVASEVIDLWLKRLVDNSIDSLYSNLGDEVALSIEDINSNIDNEYRTNDIISIKYIGSDNLVKKDDTISPIDRAIGLYAAFVIFAIMLSGEWIFNIRKTSLQNRFKSFNINTIILLLGSQLASFIVSFIFFIPLVIFLSVFLNLKFIYTIYISLGMVLFLISICSISLLVNTLVANLSQLVVLGTSVSIIVILFSSITMPLPTWSTLAMSIGRILPGTYLMNCYNNPQQLISLFIVTLFWLAGSYLSVVKLRKVSK